MTNRSVSVTSAIDSVDYADITGFGCRLKQKIADGLITSEVDESELADFLCYEIKEFLEEARPSTVFPIPSLHNIEQKLTKQEQEQVKQMQLALTWANIQVVKDYQKEAGRGVFIIPFNAETYKDIFFAPSDKSDSDEVLTALVEYVDQYFQGEEIDDVFETYDPTCQFVAVFYAEHKDVCRFGIPELIDLPKDEFLQDARKAALDLESRYKLDQVKRRESRRNLVPKKTKKNKQKKTKTFVSEMGFGRCKKNQTTSKKGFA